MRSGSGSIDVCSAVMQPNTHAIASRQVTSGSAVVLLDPEVVLLLDDVSGTTPEVVLGSAAGWTFSSESKQPPKSHALAPSATSSRGDRAEEARGRRAKAKDIGATVAPNGAPDEPPIGPRNG